MITIGICDDDQNTRTYLAKLIQTQSVSCNIDEYASGEALLASSMQYDLLFLDIQMYETDGITAAKILRSKQQQNLLHPSALFKKPVLIFVTGFEEYVYQAFDVNAFHYLLKPIDDKKFIEVFRKALSHCREISLSAAANAKAEAETLLIKSGSVFKKFAFKEIFYIESSNRKVILYTTKGPAEYYAKMSAIERQLGNTFFRCHRGFLVNLSYIAEYNTTTIKLENGSSVLMAKQKYNDFVQTYLRYLKAGGESFG